MESESQVFTVTLDEALAIFAKPRQRGARKAAEPLKELGVDPTSGGTITLREGRFGPYVTDGETNASLRKDDAPATITPERAHELLAERRARGPSKKKKKVAKKATAKKTVKKAAAPSSEAPSSKPAKKAAAKKTAKKTVTKKAAAKKKVAT